MKSVKTTITVLIIIVGFVFLLNALGFNVTAFLLAIVFPALIAVIHIISARALFTETKLKKENGSCRWGQSKNS